MSKFKKTSSDNNASEPKELASKDEIQRDFIERLEEQRQGKLITLEDVNTHSFELATWLKSIARYNNVDKTMIIVERKDNDELNRKAINIIFFTAEHKYSITAYLPKKDNNGYLGCVASTRLSKVGEWWTRGSDLPDGKFNEKTWKRILNAIVGYEIKNLQINK